MNYSQMPTRAAQHKYQSLDANFDMSSPSYLCPPSPSNSPTGESSSTSVNLSPSSSLPSSQASKPLWETRALRTYDDDIFGSSEESAQPCSNAWSTKKRKSSNSGSESSLPCTRSKRRKEDKATDQGSSVESLAEEGGGILDIDAIIDRQSKLFDSANKKVKPKGKSHAGPEGNQSVNDGVGKESNRNPYTNSIQTNWSSHDQAKIPVPSTSINYHYQLYKLHSPSGNVPLGKGVPPINVLMRHHLHGASQQSSNHKGESSEQTSFIVCPKVESQVYFGCEVNTHTEIVQQYSELLMRPNTYVLQMRVCSKSGSVVLAEEKDLAEVIREGHQPHIKFQPQKSLGFLHSTFNTLLRLPPGRYLLHHPNKEEAFIHVMQEMKDAELGVQNVFDFHKSYGFAKDADQEGCVMARRHYTTSPWLQLDTNVLTPFHFLHLKIPGTFPMDRPVGHLKRSERQKIKQKAKNKKTFFATDEEAREAIKFHGKFK